MKNISIKLLLLGLVSIVELQGQDIVSAETMQSIFNEVNTPYKYGLIMVPGADKKIDSPSVFRLRGKWYMSYVT